MQKSIAESGQIAEQTAPGVSGTSHSPTPWKQVILHPHHILADGSLARHAFSIEPGSYFGRHFPFEALELARANAAFIVRACNSHDALVKALEEMIEVYWGDGDGELPEPHCIQNARAALASAREVQP